MKPYPFIGRAEHPTNDAAMIHLPGGKWDARSAPERGRAADGAPQRHRSESCSARRVRVAGAQGRFALGEERSAAPDLPDACGDGGGSAALRQRQHPLPHRQPGKDVVYEVCRGLRATRPWCEDTGSGCKRCLHKHHSGRRQTRKVQARLPMGKDNCCGKSSTACPAWWACRAASESQ